MPNRKPNLKQYPAIHRLMLRYRQLHKELAQCRAQIMAQVGELVWLRMRERRRKRLQKQTRTRAKS